MAKFPLLGARVRGRMPVAERLYIAGRQEVGRRVKFGSNEDILTIDAVRPGKPNKIRTIAWVDKDNDGKRDAGEVVGRGGRSLVLSGVEGMVNISFINKSGRPVRQKFVLHYHERMMSVGGPIGPNPNPIDSSDGDKPVPPVTNNPPGNVPSTGNPPVNIPPVIIPVEVPAKPTPVDPNEGVFTVVDADASLSFMFDGGLFDNQTVVAESLKDGERVVILNDATDASLFDKMHQSTEGVFNSGEYLGERALGFDVGETFKLVVLDAAGVVVHDSQLNPTQFGQGKSNKGLIGYEDLPLGSSDMDFNDLLLSAEGIKGGNLKNQVAFGVSNQVVA